MADPVSLATLAAAVIGLATTGVTLVSGWMDMREKRRQAKRQKKLELDHDTKRHEQAAETILLPAPRRAPTLPHVSAQVDAGDAIFRSQAWIQTTFLISLSSWMLRLILGELAQTFALVASVPLQFTIVYVLVRLLGLSIVRATDAGGVKSSTPSMQKIPKLPQNDMEANTSEHSSGTPPSLLAATLPVSDVSSSSPATELKSTTSTSISGIKPSATSAQKQDVFCEGALRAQKSKAGRCAGQA